MIYERDSNNYLYQNWLTVKESKDQYVPLDRRNHKKVCQGAKPLVWRVFYDWVVPEEESLPYFPSQYVCTRKPKLPNLGEGASKVWQTSSRWDVRDLLHPWKPR